MRDFLEAIRSDPQFETTIHELSRAGVSVSVRRK
jgi:predicted O-methyltransferase YrrM